jgi:hypothetical protein
MDALARRRDHRERRIRSEAMTPLEIVQAQVERLSTDDLASLRRWLPRLEALRWHREMEAELEVACDERVIEASLAGEG